MLAQAFRTSDVILPSAQTGQRRTLVNPTPQSTGIKQRGNKKPGSRELPGRITPHPGGTDVDLGLTTVAVVWLVDSLALTGWHIRQALADHVQNPNPQGWYI